jgi:transposase-like protein
LPWAKGGYRRQPWSVAGAFPGVARRKGERYNGFCFSSPLTDVRWYVAYPWSTRHVAKHLRERGVIVDHATTHRWVIKYSLQLEEAFYRRKRPVWVGWRLDEPCLRGQGG